MLFTLLKFHEPPAIHLQYTSAVGRFKPPDVSFNSSFWDSLGQPVCKYGAKSEAQNVSASSQHVWV